MLQSTGSQRVRYNLVTELQQQTIFWASQVALVVNNLLANLGPIPELGRSPGEGHIATHSSIVAWRNPRTEEPGGLQSMGLQRVGHS